MEEGQNKKGLLDRLNDTYLLVVRNEETFEELGHYKLTMMGLYIFLTSTF